MSYRIMVVAVCIVLVAMAGSCKNINIPGNLAGQILNEAGQGQGYLSVACINADNGVEVSRITAEDGGNFFFEKIDAGTYIIKTYSMAGVELPNDCPEIWLGAGRTETRTITILMPE